MSHTPAAGRGGDTDFADDEPLVGGEAVGEDEEEKEEDNEEGCEEGGEEESDYGWWFKCIGQGIYGWDHLPDLVARRDNESLEGSLSSRPASVAGEDTDGEGVGQGVGMGVEGVMVWLEGVVEWVEGGDEAGEQGREGVEQNAGPLSWEEWGAFVQQHLARPISPDLSSLRRYDESLEGSSSILTASAGAEGWVGREGKGVEEGVGEEDGRME